MNISCKFMSSIINFNFKNGINKLVTKFTRKVVLISKMACRYMTKVPWHSMVANSTAIVISFCLIYLIYWLSKSFGLHHRPILAQYYRLSFSICWAQWAFGSVSLIWLSNWQCNLANWLFRQIWWSENNRSCNRTRPCNILVECLV